MRPGRRHAPAHRARTAPGPGRRIARSALLALPLLAVTVVAIVASGIVGTLSQFTASIVNPDNSVQSASVGLIETGPGGDTCASAGDGQWRECLTINKYGAADLASGGSTTTTVTLQNTGNAPAQLYMLPSQCSDTLTGAHGGLCDLVTVVVTCGGTTVVAGATLNAFHDGRNFPIGYPAGTIDGGTSVTCDVTVTAGTIAAPGAVSQPIAWRLAVEG